MARSKNAIKILEAITGENEELRDAIDHARINAQVSQLVYDARVKANLTQKELAELIGTKQPVIARLEDADYEGHSLSMLQRIAKALNQRLEIRFKPIKHDSNSRRRRMAS